MLPLLDLAELASYQSEMKRFLPALSAVLLTPTLAHAHTGHDTSGGFVSGWMHPIFGLDHLIAILAVGLWAAMLGGRARWILPLGFLGGMLGGGLLGLVGVPIPAVEPMILTSLFLFGLILLTAWKSNVTLAAVVAGGFGLFHGCAHALERPEGAFALYATGFLLATVVLMAIGLGAGLLMRRAPAIPLLRVSGAAILVAAAVLTFA